MTDEEVYDEIMSRAIARQKIRMKGWSDEQICQEIERRPSVARAVDDLSTDARLTLIAASPTLSKKLIKKFTELEKTLYEECYGRI